MSGNVSYSKQTLVELSATESKLLSNHLLCRARALVTAVALCPAVVVVAVAIAVSPANSHS